MAGDARERLLKQFRDLVGERIDKITKSLMELEGGPNSDAGKAALRELHGLKGEARMMGFAEVNTVVHEMEELVRSTQGNGFALSGGSTDALLVAADAVMVLSGAAGAGGTPPEVQKIVEWLKARTHAETGVPAPAAPAPAPAPAPAAAAAPAPAPQKPPQLFTEKAAEDVKSAVHAAMASGDKTGPRSNDQRATDSVRIGLQQLESLTSSVSNLAQIARRRELQAGRRMELAHELSQIARAVEDLGTEGAQIAQRLNRAKDLAAGLHREGKLLANEEARDLASLTEEITTLRMLPVATLFDPYPRVVRDLAKELGKDVDLIVEGGDTRADRSVVEALRDPLIHLVRNALDHGLETREERQRAGKSPRGHLTMRAGREGERVLLRVEDDGRGLDPKALREAAVRKGLMDEATAASLNDQAARDLIFVQGFSSKDAVTDISGRGVGLDVVRTKLQSLGGDVAVTSVPGQGTAFELRVPVSLTVAPLLFILAGDEKLGLTAAHVSSAVKVETEQIREMAGRPALKVRDEVLPFASVSSLLGLAPERAAKEGELVLVVHAQGVTAAISVDRVLEERVQAILPLRGLLGRFKHLSGATPLADGSLAMVLSAAHLISSARGIASTSVAQLPIRAPQEKKRRILVVDDSPLTRELISSLLEAMGYEIINANDGVDAFERLGREVVDMVVTDLEMPRMDGLELTRRLKGHATLRSLPVVIVTTRGGDADRRRGMEAGADGYVAKGDLVRQDLVDVVARLLG